MKRKNEIKMECGIKWRYGHQNRKIKEDHVPNVHKRKNMDM